jgi:hypothetical protein
LPHEIDEFIAGRRGEYFGLDEVAKLLKESELLGG